MIIDGLLNMFGVDPLQWRALLRASYLLLRRNPASIKGLRARSTSRAGGIVVMLVFYLFLGILFAFVPWGNNDPSIAASVILIPTSFFIASIILLEFGATVISPEDYTVLSVQPVSSRTYFAARISVIIFLTLLFAAVLNLPAAVSFSIRGGPLEGLAWVIASSANALATGMAMILLYAVALRLIPYRRLMALMAYLQMSISFLIYGGFGLLSSRISGFMAGITMTDPWWWYFLPPVWFASLMALAAGIWTPGNLILTLCGTVLGIIPLTALYVYQGLHGGGSFYDPFRQVLDISGMAGSSLLYIAIILFPGILKDEIGRSDNFQAAWVFFATPADRATLVLAVKRVLTVYFLIPYLFLLGFVFYYFFRNILHVVMHEVVILLASQLLLQLAFLISPRLPFSAPRGVGERIGLTTFIVVLGPLLLLVMLAFFSRFFYTNALSYLVGTSALGLLVAIVERLLRVRVSRKVGGLEFAG